ncbi:MAG TPA: hypothetical protein VGG55_03600, partial [Candidatus Acidoferrales bacterium]
DGCHTIEADWQRSKEELTPPNCSVDAVWEVKSFGSLDPDAAAEMKAAAQAKQPQPSPGNGAPPARAEKIAPKTPPKALVNPPAAKATTEKAAAEENDALETAAALRVPFGRGPKDRAFREERAQKEKNRRGKRGRR